MAAEKVEILGVPFDNTTPEAALRKVQDYLDSGTNHLVVTPNPEMVMAARKDREFMRILKNADLVLPDGIGILLASRLKGEKIRKRVTGCDLSYALFAQLAGTDHGVYLLGAQPGVAAAAREKMAEKYPGLPIMGVHDGYFDQKEERLLIKEIQAKQPDVLVVSMGSPKAEKWMWQHRNRLPVKVMLAVGGTLDIMSGGVKRAPLWMRKIGLEWLYRLVTLRRFRRMLALPRFLWAAVREKK